MTACWNSDNSCFHSCLWLFSFSTCWSRQKHTNIFNLRVMTWNLWNTSVHCGSAVILTDACFFQHFSTSPLLHYTSPIFSFKVVAIVSPPRVSFLTVSCIFSSCLLKPQNVCHMSPYHFTSPLPPPPPPISPLHYHPFFSSQLNISSPFRLIPASVCHDLIIFGL